MMAPLRPRPRHPRPDDRLLDPELWEQPRRLTRDEGLAVMGADQRSTRPMNKEDRFDD